MTVEEARKKGELEKKLRLTHPKTMREVKLRARKASDPKLKQYLKVLIGLSGDREMLVEEYKGICKFLAATRGEGLLDKDLDEYVEKLTGNALLEKEIAEL